MKLSEHVYELHLKAKPTKEGERGLPKHAVSSFDVTREGVVGDYNRYRTEGLKGDPDQALLIMPLEMIDLLNWEHWPIRPGDLGENITTEGIPYHSFKVGTIYIAGNISFEITKLATPCKNLAQLSYVGQERKAEFIKTLLNRRGWYARVLCPGNLRKNDLICLLSTRSE